MENSFSRVPLGKVGAAVSTADYPALQTLHIGDHQLEISHFQSRVKITGFREGFIVNLEQQQEVMRRQDETMDVMADSMGNIRDMSHHIANELDEQAV